MNESFDIKRFFALFSKKRFYALFLRYWAEYKITLLFLMVLSVPIVYFYEIGNGRIQLFGSFITGALSVFVISFLYLAFRCIDNKNRLAYFLLLPASGLEKFLFLLFAGIFLPYLLLLSEHYVVKGFLYFVPLDVDSRAANISDISYFFSISTFIDMFSVVMVIVTFRLLQKQSNIIHSFGLFIAGSLILKLGDDLIVQNTIGNQLSSVPFGSLNFTIEKSKFVDNGLFAFLLPYSIIAICIFGVAILYLAFMKFREIEKGL